VRNVIRFLMISIAASLSVSSQQNPSSDPSQPSQAENDRERLIRKQIREQESYLRLQSVPGGEIKPVFLSKAYREKVVPLYRKPSKKALQFLKLDQNDLRKYAEFLKQRNTGMFKLAARAGCSEHANVIVVSPECPNPKIPGAGGSYSFRVKNYRIPRLADITFDGRSLIAKGALVGAIFVNVGDIPLERIRLNTKGVGFLAEFEPSKKADEAFESVKKFVRGVESQGFIYGRGVFIGEKTTFALRSIAYRGKQLKEVAGVVYNELNFDKRRDIIVAFRIVRKDVDGTITILWKELQDMKSPKLSMPRNKKE